jgi:hypothetical protein
MNLNLNLQYINYITEQLKHKNIPIVKRNELKIVWGI